MFMQLLGAAGYLSILLMPLLIVVGIQIGVPVLGFAVVFFVFPLARKVFGNVTPGESPVWDERVATALDRLPFFYAAALTASIGYTLWWLHLGQPSVLAAVGLGLSLWMTMLMSACVAHELIHRRDWRQALVGHFIAGLSGYPVLADEHLSHHAKTGETEAGEWPRFQESLWSFAARRSRSVYGAVYGRDSGFWRPAVKDRHVRSLRIATATTLASLAAFGAAGGWLGLAIYAGVIVAMGFSLQLIHYIQHWGLGDDRQLLAKSRGYSWDDDCRLQRWMTLSISFHQSHHDEGHRPYYLVSLRPDSPRLPTGYVILMVLSLIPPLWNRVMTPVLEYWEQNPDKPRSAGRNVTCLAMYSQPHAPHRSVS